MRTAKFFKTGIIKFDGWKGQFSVNDADIFKLIESSLEENQIETDVNDAFAGTITIQITKFDEFDNFDNPIVYMLNEGESIENNSMRHLP